LNPPSPVVKDEFQFRPLNFTQKFLNTSEKILWPGELLSCQFHPHVPEMPEVKRCQARTLRQMRYSTNILFRENVFGGL
jgi:hypothetical protein